MRARSGGDNDTRHTIDAPDAGGQGRLYIEASSTFG
jgi:hypothetical protein